MTCRHILDFLMDYLNGELSAEERAIFDRHMSLCPPCVAYLKSYQETVKLEQCLGHAHEPACEEIPEELVKAILAARKKGS
jgi:anti-sigma factor RsiW